ncbi:ABC transporter substrate-binding protein [Pseudonocardia sp. HH130630-07]|nr:ABC transporter substrate-binding protein [Pseudonocardia sp. HH130630-07]
MELRHFRYVLAVAEEGTFTAAARRLGMTQPALSRAVRAVEATVGSPLFERGRRGAVLTEAGVVFRDDALALDRLARTAITRPGRHSGATKHLRVTTRGCDIEALDTLVTSYNAARGTRLPARGAVVDGSVQVEEVRTGDADVTLVRSPLDRTGLDTELLRSDARVALLPAAHPLAHRDTVDRAELAGAAVVVLAGNTASETAFWTATDLAPHEWTPGPAVSDTAQYTASIRLGHGIGFVAESLLAEMTTTGIAVVGVTGVSASELHLGWSESATSPDVAHFVRHVADVAGDRVP